MIALRAGEIYVRLGSSGSRTAAPSTAASPDAGMATPILRRRQSVRTFVIVIFDMRAHARIAPGAAARPGGADLCRHETGDDFLVHPDPRSISAPQLAAARRLETRIFPFRFAAIGTREARAQILTRRQAGRPGRTASRRPAGRQEVGRCHRDVPNAVFMRPAVRSGTRRSGRPGRGAGRGRAGRCDPGAIADPADQAVDGGGRRGRAQRPRYHSTRRRRRDRRAGAGVRADDATESRPRPRQLEREVQQHRRPRRRATTTPSASACSARRWNLERRDRHAVSLDGTITGWNPAAERLFGYSAEEAVGTKHRPDRCRPSGPRGAGYSAADRPWRADRALETVRLRKDGSPVEDLVSISPIKDPAGEIIGISTIARDLTEHRRTERALRQQTEERRRIFETSQDLIMITEFRGAHTCRSVRARDHPGLPAGRDDRPQRRDFIHPAASRDPREEMRALGAAAAPGFADTRFIHKDGARCCCPGSATGPIRFNVIFFVGRDMTESRRAAGNLARKRAARAQHHRDRARRLRPDRRGAAPSSTGTRRPKRFSAGRATK